MRRFPASVLLLALLLLSACGDDDPVGPPEQVPIDELLEGPLSTELNPSGIAPLTAEIRFRSRLPATSRLRVLAAPGDDGPIYEEPDPTVDHALPVVGLLPNDFNGVEIRLSTQDAFAVDTVFVATDSLPGFLPDVEVTTAVPEAMEAGWTLSDLAIGQDEGFHTHPIMFDGRGRIRWYLDLSGFGAFMSPLERLDNGHLIVGTASQIRELDMLGDVVRTWDIGPKWRQHHDIVEKPDGNLIVAADNLELDTVEDHIIELDRGSGEVVRVWDLREVLDVDRTAFTDFAEPDDKVDWLHVNSVWYDESDGGLIISGRNQGVFKVSADNDLQWILAPHRGWGRAGVDGQGHETSDFLLTAVDESGNPYPEPVQEGTERAPGFDWGWGQHAAMILPNGHILLFDNGDDRHFRPFQQSPEPPYSRGVEYEVDPEAMTVRQVWAYGRERGAPWFASFVSDADYLPETENRLLMPGIATTTVEPRAYVTEVTPDKQLVYEAVIRFKNAQGQRPDLVYRSERLTPYPERGSR